MKCSVRYCKNRPKPGRKMCRRCLDRARDYTRRRRAEWRATGLCIECGREPVYGQSTRGFKCLVRQSGYGLERRKRAKTVEVTG